MHEYSIVQALITSCEENATANNAQKVTKVFIKVGVMSGVEPELLKTAFDTFKYDTVCEEAELNINVQAVVILCNSCEKESTLKKNEYCCSFCQSIDIKILDGEEMYLMSLELE
ncbi:MAG: hydrogenase maturation nickel metallochaperone HypA [Helicobacteraceae bacterium]|nr:hydrogenase maturation nickel metallochaperone HypA [Helicobacteraceae bacterium]